VSTYGQRLACAWPGCGATIAERYVGQLGDAGWEFRGDSDHPLCSNHRFKSAEELDAAIAKANTGEQS